MLNFAPYGRFPFFNLALNLIAYGTFFILLLQTAGTAIDVEFDIGFPLMLHNLWAFLYPNIPCISVSNIVIISKQFLSLRDIRSVCRRSNLKPV